MDDYWGIIRPVRKLLPAFASIWISVISPSLALAQVSYQGTWSGGPTNIKVSVQSWGQDCGKRPSSDVRPATGEVRITQSGYQLFIYVPGHVVRTDSCWSQNPAVKRVSSSYLDELWTINCRTSPDDPKEEFGEYTLQAQGTDRLEYKEINRYNWKLKESNCIATITATQTFTRVLQNAVAKTAPGAVSKLPQAAASSESKPAKPECRPGAPAELVLRPKRIDLEPGQRVCIRASVVDADQCEVPDQSIEWSLRHAKALRAQFEAGCFRAADNAAEAEGEYRVVATAGSLSAQSLIVVRAVDLSGLTASRIEGAGVGGEAEIGAKTSKAGIPGKLASRDARIRTDGSQVMLLAALGSFLALGLLGATIWAVRRSRRVSSLPGSVYQDMAIEPDLPDRLELAPEPIKSEVRPSGRQWICPVCRRAFSAETRICPNDAANLVSYEEFAKGHKAKQAVGARKQCPKCGAIYPAAVAFCPEDGTSLAPIEQ